MRRILGLGGRDGHQLDAAEGKGDGQQSGGEARHAIRQEIIGEIGTGQGDIHARQDAQRHECADDEEGDDDSDLDDGEPELELTKTAHGREVDHREEGHSNKRWNPRGNIEPVGNDGGRAGDFGAHDHDQHEPVNPPHGKARPVAIGLAGVGGK